MKKGVLLINLGTPDQPRTPEVRRYLRQFLSDPRVIDIHPILRWLLVQGVILPLRSPKSAKQYRSIWFDQGSPLLVNTKALAEKVEKQLGEGFVVEVGMRYGNPSIESAIQKLIQEGVSEIRVLPLFPQQASSSIGSAVEEVFRVLSGLWNIPPVHILPPFFNHPGFIQSFAEIGKPVLDELKPDHVLFSYHGLPERHIRKGDSYQNHCFETTRLLVKELGLKEGEYSTSFQSRLGRTPWIKPYTDLHLIELVKSGKKKIAVFCPSFVADCLETLEEIGIRAHELALAHGAEVLKLVPSLNDHPVWVRTVCDLLRVV